MPESPLGISFSCASFGHGKGPFIDHYCWWLELVLSWLEVSHIWALNSYMFIKEKEIEIKV